MREDQLYVFAPIIPSRQGRLEGLKGKEGDMSSREAISMTTVCLCLRNILLRKVCVSLFVVSLICGWLNSGGAAESVLCSCGKPISKIRTVIAHTNQGEEKYCCPQCGLSKLGSAEGQVKEVRVGDYSTGKLIDAKEAYFVEGYFTESPCCKGASIPFEEHEDARKFLFMNGGQVVDAKGEMVLKSKPVPFQNNPWIFVGIAAVCLAVYFAIGKGAPEQRRKVRLIARSALVFVITFSLITAVALTWQVENFAHRVLRLSLDENGNHEVIGELDEIVLRQRGSEGAYDIGFHFFNIIEGESPKDVHLRLLNPSGVEYTFCALDGKKFDDETDTRLNLGLGHSFNIDILLKVHKEEYIGGFVFSDRKTGEVLVTMPVYIIQA
jgi:hypothetical protein